MEAQNVLIIGTVWPEPDSSAAGSRMLQLIYLFQSKGWKITFACAAADSNYMFDVETLGIEKIGIQLNHSGFDDLIKGLRPSIVLFDRFMVEEQFGWRIAQHCPDAVRILDTEDLHCLREARRQALKNNKLFTTDDLMLTTIAKREIASILRCDLSLIISDYEMTLLKVHFKINETLLYYLPFMLNTIDENTVYNWQKFDVRKNFVSIGNFLHAPNLDAVMYLKQDIWPLIRKRLPGVELYVYGAYSSQKINQLHQPAEGFYIGGRVENAKAVIENAKVLLAPLRFGAGIKGKLTDAMQCGTPSVTTTIGAEAMHANFPWSGVIANEPSAIAGSAVELYTNQLFWEQAQQHGVVIINNCYKKQNGQVLIAVIEKMVQDLDKHRIRNFTGAMLMYHSMASTKYMSKWIEAKNKALP